MSAEEYQHTTPVASFARLCETLSAVMQTRSSRRKISLFAAYLESLQSDADVSLAAQFTAEGAFPALSGRRTAVGHRTVGLTAADFCGIDYEKVFKPCRTATGSASEAIEKLMDNLPEAVARREPRQLSLQAVSAEWERLASGPNREEKQQILCGIWEQMTAREIRLMIRMMGQGSLRIGFELRSILPAISMAFGADPEEVRRVHMLTGEIGRTAVLTRQKMLHTAVFRMFQPVAFMLASPAEVLSVEKPADYIAEEKFDGMRAQVHIDGIECRLFSRDLNDITGAYPDVAAQLRSAEEMAKSQSGGTDPVSPETGRQDHVAKKGTVELGNKHGKKHDNNHDNNHGKNHASHPVSSGIVLDGELCVYSNGHIQPFQYLQKRMGVKKPGRKLIEEHPVVFIAYDLLFLDGEPVLDLPLTERRRRLEQFCARSGIPCSRQFSLRSNNDIEQLFHQALAHGNEGLVLKRCDSIYEYGQRNKSWLKIKEPGGSLDTIIMYAHAGSGRRGGTYSDFTLGIRVDEDERYEEQFIPIGKAYGGYTDQELTRLNRRIRELAVERFGPTLSLRPGIVVEVEFDDIQVNRRTKAGYTLRFPRFRAIRWDLSPADTDTLADVECLYQQRSQRSKIDSTEASIVFPDKPS